MTWRGIARFTPRCPVKKRRERGNGLGNMRPSLRSAGGAQIRAYPQEKGKGSTNRIKTNLRGSGEEYVNTGGEKSKGLKDA